MTEHRRTNKVKRPPGRHWTLTRVINGEGADYGFCQSDDETETCYIPRSLIHRYEITEDDEGAGFCARTRPDFTPEDGRYNHIMGPIVWDGEGEATTELRADLGELQKIVNSLNAWLNKEVARNES